MSAKSKKSVENIKNKTSSVSKDKKTEGVIKVKARLRFLRMSPKKVRVVANVVKNMDAVKAVEYLKLVNKAASLPLIKLINSAIANGVNNFNLQKEDLFIKNIKVNQGPSLKRWQPRAFGRATPILKRSSHIELVLTGRKVAGTKPAKEKVAANQKETIKTLTPKELKKDTKKDKDDKTVKESSSGKGDKSSFTKKFFSRKTG